MLKKSSLILGFGTVLLLSGCGHPIKDVIKENHKGLQAHDVDRVMATIDRQSPIYDSTKDEVTRLIAAYDVDVQIESLEIIKEPREENLTEEEKAKQEQAILEEDLKFITEGEQSEAAMKREQELEMERNRPLMAKVKVVQVTRRNDPKKDSSNPFYDNRVTVVHTLHKYPKDDNPTWKIYESDVTDVSFHLGDE